MQKNLTNLILAGALAGVIGGGAVLAGQEIYQNYQVTHSPVRTKATATKTMTSKDTATNAYNKVANSVVSVINFKKSGNTYNESSEGSGFVYKKAEGSAFIVTNNHVIDGADKLQVITNDNKTVTAELVGKDSLTDLAVLKITDSSTISTASFGDSAKISVGQQVLAIGSPLGSQYASSVTEGIISATKRLVQADDDSGQNYGGSTVIQTDAAINPGNSGGPLINLAGQVVGINSMKLSSSSNGTAVEGIGFAIPSDQVVDIVNKLVKDGKVTRPALGIQMINLSQVPVNEQQSTLKIPNTVNGGVVLYKVNSGSPADKAGLKKYDVIVGIDGKTVANQADLREQLYTHKVGDKTTLTYYRGTEKKTVTLKLNQTLQS
ncbi:S1C family serine protease [Fructobacillus tropaeoli]|uniref:Trypsin-like serine protease n=1 Tax=Fructobacillus tropaeoli TaxID=709323 RepID=A0A3F3H2X8_9LACO|nr:trypsin-like peptidase domain-containing protein [Fructobacillus tropaeoli]GAP04756.1 trypsin-like serine protease [Fructobacillus tropaeoli]GIC70907.1 PDZ domain-containing protein [Fructobacillus tropaeoli]CAK1250304.1 Periplasmic serine protease [Fructobacillus tropaeoli]CAK1252940.1 Periplasmic serine protease [Fructobacillus tropaeoli]